MQQKVRFIIFFFTIIFLQHLCKAQTFFEGKIEYIIDDNMPRTIQYFFNDRYIKRIDSSNNPISWAGYTEFIWDNKTKEQFIINHKLKSIMRLKYQIDSLLLKINLSKNDYMINGDSCYMYSTLSKREYTLEGNTIEEINENIWFASPKIKLPFAIASDTKFENLNLFTGYIPIKGVFKGVAVPNANTQYYATIMAKQILAYKINLKFFELPTSYQITEYDEDEIKRNTRLEMRNRMHFFKDGKRINLKGF